MKITAISQAVRDPNRVNVSVDGKYLFSLDIAQLTDLNVRVGLELSDGEVADLMVESQFGKLYARSLEYVLMRPHSSKEVRDYLWRKTRATKYRTRQGEIKDREGVSRAVVARVYDRLLDRGYLDDAKFARYWVENRNQTKGSSRRKLVAELRSKGVESVLIEQALAGSDRNDDDELLKVIAKKRRRYPEEQKFIAYLAGQGFSYDAIKRALSSDPTGDD